MLPFSHPPCGSWNRTDFWENLNMRENLKVRHGYHISVQAMLMIFTAYQVKMWAKLFLSAFILKMR